MLLRLGFLVVTFNFRGACGSPSRRLWKAKPEHADYASVAGFVAYYVHYLDPFGTAAAAITSWGGRSDSGSSRIDGSKDGGVEGPVDDETINSSTWIRF